jgi:hypothetical protein
MGTRWKSQCVREVQVGSDDDPVLVYGSLMNGCVSLSSKANVTNVYRVVACVGQRAHQRAGQAFVD